MQYSSLEHCLEHLVLYLYGVVCVRESEGSFRYGHYRREADDLRAVVQYFRAQNYVIVAVVGHSKGLSIIFAHLDPKPTLRNKRRML